MNIRIIDKAEFRYRLGDLVLLGNDALSTILDPKSPFQNTIGYEYAHTTLARNRFLDFKLLGKIVRKHTQIHGYAIPQPNELVLHYRAGDFKRVKDAEIGDLVSHVKNACAKSHLTYVHIVTAFHYGNKHAMFEQGSVDELTGENHKNLDKTISLLRSLNFVVSVKDSGSIDEDFCFLSNAKHFLPSKGGYSVLAALCNTDHVYPSFPETNRAISHYGKIRHVSLSMSDLMTFVRKKFLLENHNPVYRLLKKTQPEGNRGFWWYLRLRFFNRME